MATAKKAKKPIDRDVVAQIMRELLAHNETHVCICPVIEARVEELAAELGINTDH